MTIISQRIQRTFKHAYYFFVHSNRMVALNRKTNPTIKFKLEIEYIYQRIHFVRFFFSIFLSVDLLSFYVIRWWIQLIWVFRKMEFSTQNRECTWENKPQTRSNIVKHLMMRNNFATCFMHTKCFRASCRRNDTCLPI